MIRRPQFERLWADSSEGEQACFRKLIAAANRDSARDWMREHPSLDLAEKKLCDLQEIGYKLGIKNYSRLSKLELVRAIRMKEEKYGTHQSISA